MPYDPSEYGGYEQFIEPQFEDEGETFVTGVSSPPIRTVDPVMVEAERRMEKATYYKALLQDSFFESDAPMALEVEAEIRNFVRSRFNALLGVGAPKPPEESFTPDDVKILKNLAESVRKKIQQPAPAQAPQVQQQVRAPAVHAPVQQPVAQPEPVVVAPPPPPEPKLKKRRGPKPSKAKEPVAQPTAQKQIIKTVTSDGRTVTQDITRQVRPGPNGPQPMKIESKQQLEAISAMHAAGSVGKIVKVD